MKITQISHVYVYNYDIPARNSKSTRKYSDENYNRYKLDIIDII